MQVLLLLVSLYLALPLNCIFIIFPLYLYPGDNGIAWSDVTSTIDAYAGVQWQIVVNPNSGPGTSSYPSDPNIISGLAKLNSYSNVNTVGYVDTAHGQKDISLVNAETDVYASWAGYSTNISIGGIYFDDVSSEESSSMYSYYETVAAHARSSMKTSAHVVFNPGDRAPTQLFSYADTIVEFEDSLANYQSEGIIEQIPTQFRGQSALQIYSTPEGTDVGNLISTMAQSGIEAVYFGEDCCYKVYSKALIQDMAEAV